MPAYNVRKPTPDDLRALADVLAPLPFFSPQNDAAVLLQAWQKGLANGDGLLSVYDNDRPIGLCWFLTSGTFGNGAYLRLIVVLPSEQGKGVGSRLLAAFEKACQGSRGGCFVLTNENNRSAQEFYARNGYKVVGTLPKFAAPDRTEQILWKVMPVQILLSHVLQS